MAVGKRVYQLSMCRVHPGAEAGSPDRSGGPPMEQQQRALVASHPAIAHHSEVPGQLIS